MDDSRLNDYNSCWLEQDQTYCKRLGIFKETFTDIRTGSDLVFVQDSTAGHGSYLLMVAAKIEEIFSVIKKHNSDNLCIRIISYIQHQDCETFGFDFILKFAEIWIYWLHQIISDSLPNSIDEPTSFPWHSPNGDLWFFRMSGQCSYAHYLWYILDWKNIPDWEVLEKEMNVNAITLVLLLNFNLLNS